MPEAVAYPLGFGGEFGCKQWAHLADLQWFFVTTEGIWDLFHFVGTEMVHHTSVDQVEATFLWGTVKKGW